MNSRHLPVNRLPVFLLGLVLAYVLVVQAIVAPLHALASVPLSADHGLAVICASHGPAGENASVPLAQVASDCCEIGCAPALDVWNAPHRGAGVPLYPPRIIGVFDPLAVEAMGPIPPERLNGARHPPRAPPAVLALM